MYVCMYVVCMYVRMCVCMYVCRPFLVNTIISVRLKIFCFKFGTDVKRHGRILPIEIGPYPLYRAIDRGSKLSNLYNLRFIIILEENVTKLFD